LVVHRSGNAVVTAEAELRLLCTPAALLGGHVDDAVGGTRTVDGSCGCVLQRDHVLDVVRVHGEELVGRRGHTVDDVQRFGTCRDGARTVDTDGRTLGRFTRRGHYGHTGHLAGKCVGDVHYGLVVQYVRIHDGHGTGYRTHRTGRTVTDYDHLFDLFVVFGEFHVGDSHTGSNRHFLSGESEVFKNQNGIRGNVVERVFSFHAGNGCILRAFYDNGSAHDGV